jgi:hypothetical protein
MTYYAPEGDQWTELPLTHAPCVIIGERLAEILNA